MRRAPKFLLVSAATAAIAAAGAGCGTQKIKVSRQQSQIYHGAVLFQQRCSGCHTLSYAATHGSAASVLSAQYNNGPDFDVRCERPIARVLYAIENGGFSGAIMPQNVVVGQDAIDVAKFVATYSGRQAPRIPGTVICANKPVGTIAQAVASTTTTASATTGPTGASGGSGTTGASGTAKKGKAKPKHKRKR